jgi:hypothetical protein
MATSDDISGAPLQTRQALANAMGQAGPRGGIVLADNDNRRWGGYRPRRYRLNRHERDAAIHLAKHPQQDGEAVAVVQERQQLGVLCFGLQVLRGALQIQGVLRHLGRGTGIRLLATLDLDGQTARLDRERGRRATTGAPESEKVLGVDHDGLQAGDRHRAEALTRVDGGITR